MAFSWHVAGRTALTSRWRDVDEEAVSPVVGTILMVAIAVVLAAVVFVLATKLSSNKDDQAENVGITVNSPTSPAIYVNQVKAGQNSPYDLSDMQVFIDNTPCTLAPALHDANGDGRWGVGEAFVFTSDCQSPPVPLGAGESHLVYVLIHGHAVLHYVKVTVS